jgi:hypothetical protein
MSIVTKADPLPPILVQKPLLAAKQATHFKSFEDLVPAGGPSLLPVPTDNDGAHLVDIVV